MRKREGEKKKDEGGASWREREREYILERKKEKKENE